MRHVIISSEYPPAPSAGGIGTYAMHLSRLLAESGDTVHVIALRWPGAPRKVEKRCGGRLIIHRVPLDVPIPAPGNARPPEVAARELRALHEADFRAQAFAWQAGLFTERLVEGEAIDVIEAQDWEAPLYYFQLRRALGLGPRRQPPCIVHLHSPAEFIFRHNEWSMGWPGYLSGKRYEDYSIGAADALLCPSAYLAEQAQAHYGLAARSIEVIPLPLGDFPALERGDDVWKHGSICYVGRLEPRKGLLEWVDAAVAVARDDPSAQFEFIGADLPYDETRRVQAVVERRIPDGLRRRFHFRGAQPRSALPRYLAQARIAVVPSRWENFPNSCIEAMCSGLPVMASRQGGMAAMIEDGQTGWLAASQTPSGLADALRTALATPPPVLAAMGAQAARAIRRLCDNTQTLQRHVEFRRRVVEQGPGRSRQFPVTLPSAGRRLDDSTVRRTASAADHAGLALVVTCLDDGLWLDDCLRSIEDQIRAALAVVIIADPSREPERAAVVRARALGWTVHEHPGVSPAAAKNAGIGAVLAEGWQPLGFAFLGPADRLAPDFVEKCELVLRRCRDVGLVSAWTDHAGRTVVRPCPAFPYQLVRDETAPTTLVRTEALTEAGLHRTEMYPPYEAWDLANAVISAGWVAVTFPAILSTRISPPSPPAQQLAGYDQMRRLLLERVPSVLRQDSVELLLLTETWGRDPDPGPPTLGRPEPPDGDELLRRSLHDLSILARWAIRHPYAALQWGFVRLRGEIDRRWSRRRR
jgi:glycosyltransferase involved in cell wall biosynthesis